MPNIFIKFNLWLVLLPLLGILAAFLFFKRFFDSGVVTIPHEVTKVIDFYEADHTLNPVNESLSKSGSKTQVNSDSVSKAVSKLDLRPLPKLEDKGRGPFADSEALKVQETFKVDPPMRSIGQDWKAGRKISNFTMPVSEGRNLEIQVERFECIGEEGGTFIGTVIGAPGSTVNLSYRGSSEAGRIDIPSEGRSYRILPAKDGAIIVQDRNPSLDVQLGAVFPSVGIELPPVPDFIPPPPPSGIFEAIPRSGPLP